MLAKHKASVFEKFLINLSPNDGSLWRATKRTCKLSSQNIPIKKSDGSFVCTDLDKAELFKDCLYETFQPHPDIFSLENNMAIAESLNSSLPVSRPVKHFSPSEVKFVIDKYPHKKSPGFDLITGKVARCLPKKAIIHLTHIFNCILRLSYFPILWKFSTIIMIPKAKKPPDSVSSFRLLPFFAKVLEKLILKRILPSISNSVLPDAHFGFRSAHSTIHQVHRIVDAISFSLEKKQYCTCAFLDVSQAFDRPIWTYGIPLWGNAKISNINKIQTFQNIALRKLLNAPPYVSNLSIQQDLRMNSIKDEAKLYYKRFHSRLLNHPNPLIKNLAVPSIPGNPLRRLKRNWCRDLLNA
ncbi:hypothetical protein QTP88_008851 [Uroleucon formosanum]